MANKFKWWWWWGGGPQDRRTELERRTEEWEKTCGNLEEALRRLQAESEAA